jgi:hypothetical protein
LDWIGLDLQGLFSQWRLSCLVSSQPTLGTSIPMS